MLTCGARRSRSTCAPTIRNWPRSTVSASMSGSCQTVSSRRAPARCACEPSTRSNPIRAEFFALAREASRRAIGLWPFDVQVRAALALDCGHIVEMQTGEGKTLAAVMPAALRALAGQGAHVLTFNDYLARRDAEWMGPVYAMLGLSVGFVQQGMTPEDRRRAYLADVTYVTAKEAGFDHLRDLLAMDRQALVHRPFHFALVDEADSLLIDEARVPLVIAGSVGREMSAAPRLAALVASLTPGVHFDTDEYSRDVELTEAGVEEVERVAWRRPTSRCRELHAADRTQLRAPRARAPAARRRLHRARRSHRSRRRVHGPGRRRSSLARRPAGGARGEGGRRTPTRWTDPGLDHAAAFRAGLPAPVRHDRYGADSRVRAARAVRAPRGRRADAPTDDPRRSPGHRLHPSRRQGARGG